MCAPIVWLGYPNPLDSQERLRELDPEAEKLGLLMAAWWDMLGTNWHTVGDVINALEAPYDKPAKIAQRDALNNAILDAASDGRDRVNRKTLGWYLSSKDGRIFDDFRLKRKLKGESKSKKSQQYRVINVSLLDRKK